MPQTPVPTPPQGAVTPVAPPAVAMPRAAQSLSALRARRTELSSQIRSLEASRGRLAARLDNTGDAAARTGQIERLAELDKRIIQLDADFADVERQIASAGPELAATTAVPPPIPRSGEEGPIIVTSLLIIFVLFPLALAFARRMWKRTPSASPTAKEWNDVPQRMERLEHAIDAVAIEVERVSESQRFMTRLMTESELGPAMSAVRASADAARDVAAQPAEVPELKALGAGERPFEPIKAAEHEDARLRGRR